MSETRRDHPKQNKPDLERLGTEELEELLRIAQRTGEAASDFILRVLEVIERREQENPTGRLPDTEAALASFKKHYLPVAENGGSLYENDEETPFAFQPSLRLQTKAKHRVRRIILFAAVMTILIGSLVAQAAGIDVLGAIARWSAETFHFESLAPADSAEGAASPLPDNTNQSYSAIKEALASHGITGMIVPTWWPEGFETTELKTTANEHRVTLNYVCSKGDKTILYSVHQYAAAGDISDSAIEKDENQVTLYEKNRTTHYIMSNFGAVQASWKTGALLCSISGDITEQALVQMIDSIYRER